MNLSPTPNRYKSSRQPGVGNASNTLNNNNNNNNINDNGGPFFNSNKHYADKLYTRERRNQDRAPFSMNNENNNDNDVVLPQPYIDNGNVLRTLKRENTELRLAVAEKSAELDQMAVLVESFRKKLEKYKTANGDLQRELATQKELNNTQRNTVQELQQENTTLKQQHREPLAPSATTRRESRKGRRHNTQEEAEDDSSEYSDEEYVLPFKSNKNTKKTQFELPKRNRSGHSGSLSSSSSSSPAQSPANNNELQIQNLNLKLDNLMAYIRDGNANTRIPSEQQTTVTPQSHTQFDSFTAYNPPFIDNNNNSNSNNNNNSTYSSSKLDSKRYVPQDEDIMVQESVELKELEEKIENMKRKLIIKKQNELRKISLNQEMLELMEKLDPSPSSTTKTSQFHTHSQVHPQKTRVFSENSMECQTCTTSLKNTPDKKNSSSNNNNNNNNNTNTNKPYTTNKHVFQNTLQNNPTLAELSDLKTDVKYYVDDDERSGVW